MAALPASAEAPRPVPPPPAAGDEPDRLEGKSEDRHLPSLWICGRWQSEAPGPADGLQPGVLCPATSPLTLAVPTCLREGTMWTSHARPSVGWQGGWWPWAKASVPRPPQQRRQQQRGVLGQASPTCGRRALAPEAHHQPVQVRAAPAAHEQAHHLHGRAAALVQRARHPVQGGLRHRPGGRQCFWEDHCGQNDHRGPGRALGGLAVHGFLLQGAHQAAAGAGRPQQLQLRPPRCL